MTSATVAHMDNVTRFERYLAALQQFISREHHGRVPSNHVEIIDGTDIFLGAWVSYVRQRRRQNKLKQEFIVRLETIPEWTWGPLKRGPKRKIERNEKIIDMRSQGHSITQISDEFNISRQRVHQIVKHNVS